MQHKRASVVKGLINNTNTMQTVRKIINPALAEVLLSRGNTRNRNLSAIKVNLYADDMKQGRWTLHHQGIAFYSDGELADGQHRLAALIKANVTLEFMVTYNISKEAGADIDRHRARSESDAIRIGGLSDWIGKTEVSVIKALANVHGSHPNRFTAKQIADLGELVKEEVPFAVNACKSRQRFVTTAPVMAAIAIASDFYDKEKLNAFAQALSTGIPVYPEDMTALRLRESLIANHGGSGGSTGRGEVVKRTLRAIELYMDGKQAGRLKTPKEMTHKIPKLEAAV